MDHCNTPPPLHLPPLSLSLSLSKWLRFYRLSGNKDWMWHPLLQSLSAPCLLLCGENPVPQCPTGTLPALPHGWFWSSSSPPTATRSSTRNVYTLFTYKKKIVMSGGSPNYTRIAFFRCLLIFIYLTHICYYSGFHTGSLRTFIFFCFQIKNNLPF